MAPNPQSSTHEQTFGQTIHARVRLSVKTDVPHLHKLMQQMASYHDYTKVFTSTQTSISTNLFDSNPCPPFYSATALILEVSPNSFPPAVLPVGFDPVYKTLHLGSAIADPESETYESQEGDDNVVVAGYILFYPSYSGYFEKPSIFMENLYVRECYREFGLGKMLFSAMAARAATLGFSTADWLVVGWNVKAIEFYVGMGGQIMQDVKRFRLSGEGLKAFAKEQDEQ
ncbi:PREDICTED: tyramine N-feruloyltransferase 4/11-like [Ipomoea nil]|uniref:tyramine N-feruloyltransferase 4/11-like n=1 Tax=Ipomoea nil TaxID=35883 RepID=UPI000900D74C|nr:PREDICTED: tyramine N-feruloyltransferase 4/11-like [Ipomoea nil]